ncbi:hypothetical protein [Streptomyces niveus]|uniref:hypothetical protein n=1 Tax=Streptomyces niveus TaxID=193462 RepID=UPI003695BE65
MGTAPLTLEERRHNGDEMTAVFIRHAIDAGATLTAGDRAELGRAMAEAYNARSDEFCAEHRLGDLVADLYHCADGIATPAGMLGAALLELSVTVNTLPLLASMGEDGRPGILACALAAVLAYGESLGVCPHGVTDEAYKYWADEVEEARFMEVRDRRFNV